ncbi:MAG: coenzyme A pyrophosphatase [Rubrivivax sp. SCN 71-131]|jgi:8-oxo-dGTP pyrophosphatase MutT (NUDIX family)|nr:MAG: coenzyme A pyrophosphatase [Rubrivivax sp. SCN 71-131]
MRDLLQRRLGAFDVLAHDDACPAHVRRAAVALVVVEEGHGAEACGIARLPRWSTEPALLLTLRASGMRQHAGQWALPGGRIDRDETPEQTALRELREEVGLELGSDALLGRLDDYVTRSGYAITPLVFWGGDTARALQPNPQEVASVHRVPVAELMREDAPILEHIPQSPRPVLGMPLGSGWIAAPTAVFLYQFREVCIADRATRVAHFEQPLFAWK